MGLFRNILLVCLLSFVLVSVCNAANAAPAAQAANAAPAGAKPVEPVKPAAAKPVEPVKPAAAEPVKPAAAKPAEPAKPVAAEPVKPAAAKPAEPAKPAAAEPVKPAAAKPAEPAKPAAAEPVKPAAAKPAEPAKAAEPAKPAAAKPAKPATKENKPKAAPAAPADEGFTVEKAQQVATEYLNQASDVAAETASKLLESTEEYTKVARDNAHRFVDQYLAKDQAKWVKSNLFNPVGIIGLILAIVVVFMVTSRLTWVFSLNYVRAFLSSFGLGVFFTLYGLTIYVKDPKDLLAKNSPGALENFETATFYWFSFLVALNTAAMLNFSLKNLIQFAASGLLFVEHFGIKKEIEAQIGVLPPHTIHLAVFAVLSVLSFSQLESHANRHIRKTTHINVKPEFQTKAPTDESAQKKKANKQK